MNFSQKIIELRKEKGFTQKSFAEKIGTTDKVIWTYEKGKSEPSIAMLKQISEVLGVSVGYLVGAEDEDGRPVPADLSEEDRKLLAWFHGMDKAQQRAILRTAESLYIESQPDSLKLS